MALEKLFIGGSKMIPNVACKYCNLGINGSCSSSSTYSWDVKFGYDADICYRNSMMKGITFLGREKIPSVACRIDSVVEKMSLHEWGFIRCKVDILEYGS